MSHVRSAVVVTQSFGKLEIRAASSTAPVANKTALEGWKVLESAETLFYTRDKDIYNDAAVCPRDEG